MINAIAISRNLAAAGLEKQAADAIAEAVVTHSDDTLATKANFAKLESDFSHLEGSVATKADLAKLEGRMNTQIAEVKTEIAEVKSEIAELRTKLNVFIGLVIATNAGIAILILDRTGN